MQFLKVHDTSFMAGNSKINLKGVGLGNWLNLEHFMFGLPGTDTQIRELLIRHFGEDKAHEFWDYYYQQYISEKDIEFVAKQGYNHIRIAVNYKLFLTHEFSKSVAIIQIDRILGYCKKYGLWAIIDMHAVPGGQNPDWHSDNNTGKDNFWFDNNAMQLIIELWGDIASYYKNEPAIGGYDLINEPCYFSKDVDTIMVHFFEKCTQEIRTFDNNHILFYSGNVYSRDFSMFKRNIDENCSYTFHLYPFLQLGRLLKDNSDIDYCLQYSLENDVTLHHLQQQLKKPLWCGETGLLLSNVDDADILRTFITLLEQYDIGWALWPLKDCGQMGLLTSNPKSEWNTLCSTISEKWNFWDSFHEDSAIAVSQEIDKYAFYKRLANIATGANAIVDKNLSNVSFHTLKNALNSFNFENCLRHSVMR